MPEQRSKFGKRIQYLNRLVFTKRDNRGNRDLTEEEIAKYNRELKELLAKRNAEQRIGATMAKETDRAMQHTTGEANRVIAATNAGTATLEQRFDRLETMIASSSSGRDDLLQRLVGRPGSSKEIQAEIDARKEDLKRKRKEEREEEKQAEKRRKLEGLFEIPLEEGDTLQDGVVLRGDQGRRKLHGLQAVGDFRFGRLRCCLVEIGETATLQLHPMTEEQVNVLGSMTESTMAGTIVKLLAVTKDGTVEAQFVKEKLCGPNRRPITPMAVRFTSRRFDPSAVFTPKPAEEIVEPAQPVETAEEPAQPVETTVNPWRLCPWRLWSPWRPPSPWRWKPTPRRTARTPRNS